MTRDELQRIFVEELGRSAPESDPATLGPTQPIRETLDLDSFDFQNLIARLESRLGARIPEADYPKLDTLGGAVDYLEAHAPR